MNLVVSLVSNVVSNIMSSIINNIISNVVNNVINNIISSIINSIVIWFDLIWFEFIHFYEIDLSSIHEKNYVIYIKWIKLSEKENCSLTTWWFHIIETMNFDTILSIMNL